jgi:hypothetical protein
MSCVTCTFYKSPSFLCKFFGLGPLPRFLAQFGQDGAEEGASQAWWPWRAREVAGGGHGGRAGGWRGQEGGRELYGGEGRMGAPTVEGEGCAGSTVRMVSVRLGIDMRGGG